VERMIGSTLRRTVVATAAAAVGAVAAAGCGDTASLSIADGTGPEPVLPPPQESLVPTVDVAPAVGWPDGASPEAGAGLRVEAFARELDHPRWLYVLPNGDVLVAESNAPAGEGGGIVDWVMGRVMERAGAGVPSADRITLLRDGDGDGEAETRTVFIDGLHSPFGMALVGRDFYVANTDALVRFDYEPGATRIEGEGEKIVSLPAGKLNQHWTRNVIANEDGTRLYVTVGSASNIADNGIEAEERRAAILEVDPEARTSHVYASGLRNPNGLDWEPVSGELWTTVNERDGLGGDLVPDYMTAVEPGGFYGWPYSYFGDHLDHRVEPQRPDLVATAIVPDYALGAHTASLGLAFYEADLLPPRYRDGAFVAQHGSWNRKPLAGYRVIYVPFAEGEPAGRPADVLTGFVNDDGEAQGRPVGVAVDARGAVLVADDVGNAIWRLVPENQSVAAAEAR
jgi:glucose/arabinose dehydrogenase